MSEHKKTKRVKKKQTFIKRFPKALWVVLFLILVTALLYWLNLPLLGFYLRQPDTQTVFWQTMDKNLKSSQVSLKSAVTTSVQGQPVLVLENELKLNLQGAKTGFWSQGNLVFDEGINEVYPNPDQVGNYAQLGVKELPKQDWYHQEVLVFDQQMYMRHYFKANPEISNWQTLVDDPLADLPQSEQWYEVPLRADSARENVYNFLVGQPASDALFYGSLNEAQRRDFIELLRSAYEVNWRQVESFYEGKDLHYKYQVRLDHQNFSTALIDFYNLHIEKEEDKFGADQSVFQPQDVVYEIIIDVKRRKVTKVRHGVVVPLTNYDNYLALRHQHSPLIYYLTRLDSELLLRVETKIVSQNQALELKKPHSLPIPSRKIGGESDQSN